MKPYNHMEIGCTVLIGRFFYRDLTLSFFLGDFLVYKLYGIDIYFILLFKFDFIKKIFILASLQNLLSRYSNSYLPVD